MSQEGISAFSCILKAYEEIKKGFSKKNAKSARILCIPVDFSKVKHYNKLYYTISRWNIRIRSRSSSNGKVCEIGG